MLSHLLAPTEIISKANCQYFETPSHECQERCHCSPNKTIAWGQVRDHRLERAICDACLPSVYKFCSKQLNRYEGKGL